MNYFEEIRQVALQYSNSISAEDGRFDGCVFIHHFDGTYALYHNAFAIDYPGHDGKIECVVVITEHNGVHVFAKEDLRDFGQFGERTKIEASALEDSEPSPESVLIKWANETLDAIAELDRLRKETEQSDIEFVDSEPPEHEDKKLDFLYDYLKYHLNFCLDTYVRDLKDHAEHIIKMLDEGE